MWRRIHALVIKEFLALMKDRKIRLVLIVPPLMQMILFANAATFDVTDVAFGIWDEDGSGPAVELIHRFTDSPAFVYGHRWRVGDLVLWDNRSTMHRRDPFDNAQRRVMHRTQIKGKFVPRPLVAATAAALAK